MALTDNPFALLGAMPGDDRLTLNDKADEAALLGGVDTEDALNGLMQLNRRIPAELGWLPGATSEAAEAFVTYARAASEGEPARIPPLDGLGTPLAQANALAALFERWPADEPELFMGLCRSMDIVLSQVTAEDTLNAVNADRAAGRWEAIPDALSLNGPLNDRLRELCAPVAQAMEALDRNAAKDALQTLFGPGGIDPQGSVAQAAADAYSMRVHEEADRIREPLLRDAERVGKENAVYKTELEDLKQRSERWRALMGPLCLAPGKARNDARDISHGLRNALVNYVNKSGTVKKTKAFRIPVFNGTKVYTIEYQSCKEAVDLALDFNAWMKRLFPEQVDLMHQLEGDEAQLRELVRKEEAMLAKAEADARSRTTLFG